MELGLELRTFKPETTASSLFTWRWGVHSESCLFSMEDTNLSLIMNFKAALIYHHNSQQRLLQLLAHWTTFSSLYLQINYIIVFIPPVHIFNTICCFLSSTTYTLSTQNTCQRTLWLAFLTTLFSLRINFRGSSQGILEHIKSLLLSLTLVIKD